MKRNESVRTLSAEYICNFEPNELGGYTVICPKLPAVVTQGRTLAEARRNAREAIELVLETYQEDGTPIPPSDRRRPIRTKAFAKASIASA